MDTEDVAYEMLASEITPDIEQRLDLSGTYKDTHDDERFNVQASSQVAAGTQSISFPPIPPGQDWLIDRVTFATDNAGAVVAVLRQNDTTGNRPDAIRVVSPTMVGGGGLFFAVADLSSRIYARAYEVLTVTFYGLAGTPNVYANIQYALRQGEPVKED